VHTEVDPDVLNRAAEALQRQGVTVQRAVQLMLEYVALEGELPLDFFPPNEETKAAMNEARRGRLKRFNTVEEFLADLNADDAESSCGSPAMSHYLRKNFTITLRRVAGAGTGNATFNRTCC